MTEFSAIPIESSNFLLRSLFLVRSLCSPNNDPPIAAKPEIGMRLATNTQFTPVQLVIATPAVMAANTALIPMEEVDPVVRNQRDAVITTQMTSREMDDWAGWVKIV